MQVAEPQMAGFFAWAPDGRSLFMRKQVSENNVEIWRVPLGAGQPAKLDFNPGNIPGFLVHPNGKQVVFPVAGARRPMQIWALENFLPVVSVRK